MKHASLYSALVLVICLLMLKTCAPVEGNTRLIDVVTIERDTIVSYRTVSDTVVEYNTVVDSIHDTIINNVSYPVNEYTFNVVDSVINGTITVQSPFKPVLRYELTTQSKTITKHTTTTITNLKGFMYGGQLTVEPILSQIEINIAYQNKKGNIYKVGGGYDFHQQKPIVTIGLLKRF